MSDFHLDLVGSSSPITYISDSHYLDQMVSRSLANNGNRTCMLFICILEEKTFINVKIRFRVALKSMETR